MEKEFDLLVFVGRFQPFHNEHKRVIDVALEKAKNVLVLVGSSGKARTIRNPFTFGERRQMIYGSYKNAIEDSGAGARPVTDRLIIQPLYDKTYNDLAWVKQIQDIVTEHTLQVANPGTVKGQFRANGTNDVKVGLIGAAKDHTSYYLKLFPQWGSVDVPIHRAIHATAVREGYLDGTFERYQLEQVLVPRSTAEFLFGHNECEHGFSCTEEYQQLRRELQHVRNYKKAWAAAPYPVKHATIDAVVEQSGHVLVVKRKAEPGAGLWAIPGGHLEPLETQLNGAIRELKEETGLKVPEAVLRGSIAGEKTFDDPYRSTLGRVITQAFYFKLADDVKLPKVRIPKGEHGEDEVSKLKWLPISEMREEDFFDDHFAIVQYFLGL